MQEMFPFWYGGGKEYDELCRSFKNVIQAAGKGELEEIEEEWHKTVDGKMAQLLLCDQLSRNAFRGTDKAFAYDDKAMDIARDMSKGLLGAGSGALSIPNLSGDCYIPYLQFVTSPLMHSEAIADHELALEVADYSLGVAPDYLQETFREMKNHEIEHKEVIDKFGRYPHRNNKLGRESTKEELEWLSQEDELPGWAKSQG